MDGRYLVLLHNLAHRRFSRSYTSRCTSGNGLDHFRCFFHDLWYGDMDYLLNSPLTDSLMGNNVTTATISVRIDSGTSTSTICSTTQSGTRSWHRNVDVALHDALLDPLLWNGSEGPPGNKT